MELFDDGLGKNGEFNVRMLIIQVLGKLSNALGVGLGLKLETLALEEELQLFVVGDDAIVNYRKLPFRIGPSYRD